MLRGYKLPIAFGVIGSIFLVASGANPQGVNVPLEIGLAFVTAAAILYFQRLLVGEENKEVLVAIEELQQEIIELRQQIEGGR